MRIGDAECEVWLDGREVSYRLVVTSQRTKRTLRYCWHVEAWAERRDLAEAPMVKRSPPRADGYWLPTYAAAFRAAMREADKMERRKP